MGALVSYVVRRHLPLVAIAAALAFVFLGSFVWLGVTAFYVWALALVGAVVLLQVLQGAGGSDPRLDAEEAERRAAIMRGDR